MLPMEILSTSVGFLCGTWEGTTYELDIDGGYSGEVKSLIYDVGFVQHKIKKNTKHAIFLWFLIFILINYWFYV
jgi:hypothetical protein